MAMMFKVPENLDIDFKFIGNKYGLKDIAIRSVGLIVAIPFTAMVHGVSGSKALSIFTFLVPTIVGIYYGSKRVYDGALGFFEAMKIQHQTKERTTTLYNTRLNGGVEFERTDKTKEEVYNYDYEIDELETELERRAS